MAGTKDFRIATPREHARLLREDAESIIAEFVELQDGATLADRPRHARRITVICLKDAAAPHGLLIWRLHESLDTAGGGSRSRLVGAELERVQFIPDHILRRRNSSDIPEV